MEDALARYGKPDIFDTDQGSQFTGAAFTGPLACHGIAIKHGRQRGMAGQLSGCGAASITRRSICVPTKPSARHDIRLAGISTFYNGRRTYSSLDDMTPDQPTSTRCHSTWRPNPGRGST
jgi:putative transposase